MFRRKYKHLTQQQFLCGPTCVQMILFRRGKWVGQEKLGSVLGVKIPKEVEELYEDKFEFVENKEDSGFRIDRFSEKDVKEVFSSFKLKVKVSKISTIEDLPDFFRKQFENGSDVIANISWKPLRKTDGGHYVLISEFNPETNQVTVCDPSPSSKNHWTIDLDDLARTMTDEWDGRERGFVSIRN